MVYVDDAIWNWQGLKWCHLLADDIDELHGFAARLGISRASYQGPPKTTAPHYDLTGFERARALALGAKPCSRQEIVAVSPGLRVGGREGSRQLWLPVTTGKGPAPPPPHSKTFPCSRPAGPGPPASPPGVRVMSA